MVSYFGYEDKDDFVLLIVRGGNVVSFLIKVFENKIFIYFEDEYLNFLLDSLFVNILMVKMSFFENYRNFYFFIGNYFILLDFGNIFLLKIIEINFLEEFERIGIVIDVIFIDFNNDGKIDLIVIGEWM